jgi:antitoxin VapB
MALSIKNPEADRLARELARRTGKGITEVVVDALRERLAEVERRSGGERTRAEIERIRERVRRLEVRDPRSPDEIIGYDELGLPT